MTTIESLTDKALDAFWQVIVERFPQASSGDLSPLATIRLSMAARDAIAEWISYNVAGDIVTGYRFRLFSQVDRYPDFLAPAGMTGVVTIVDESGVWGRMDQHLTGAEHWDNQIHWQTPYDFAADTVPLPSTLETESPKGNIP
jgi:hypothetical protein